MHITTILPQLKVNTPMITHYTCLPSSYFSCEWVVITHKIMDCIMSGDDCYRNGKKLTLTRCGGSNGYKIGGRFRSLTWINQNKKPTIDVWFTNLEAMPF